MLKEKQNGNAVTETVEIAAWTPANVNLISNYPTVKLDEGTSLFTDLSGKIEAIAPELKGMKAFRFNGNEQREKGNTGVPEPFREIGPASRSFLQPRFAHPSALSGNLQFSGEDILPDTVKSLQPFLIIQSFRFPHQV